MKTSPKIIAVAGPSCSGKSFVAKALVAELGESRCQSIALDHYYRDLRGLSPAERERRDFDCPDALESELLVEYVAQLRQGDPVVIPQYDFSIHLRSDATSTVLPAPFIILEGLFALGYPALLPMIDVGVFIDIDDDTALARRIRRDVQERGRTMESVVAQFRTTVQPAVERYIRPSAAAATLRFDGTVDLKSTVAAIMAHLN
jgi:uridine kinase